MSDSITVVEGVSINFVCEATNDLDAIIDVTIIWFDDNYYSQNLLDSDRVTITTTTETGPNRTVMSTLTIDPVIHQDAGQYRCQVLNHVLLRVDETTQLTVQCKLTSSLSVHTSVIVM